MKTFMKWLRRQSPITAGAVALILAFASVLGWVVGLGQNLHAACEWSGFCKPPPPPLELSSTASSSRVFFDFNKSTLTAEDMFVLRDAAETLRYHPEYDVIIQAFSDTLFDDNNKPLPDELMIPIEDRRAMGVRNELLRDGIRPERIGFHKSVIAVSDREPASRTVIITIGPPK